MKAKYTAITINLLLIVVCLVDILLICIKGAKTSVAIGGWIVAILQTIALLTYDVEK